MAQNFNYYAIVGNNGYGMSPDWSDIASNVNVLQNEWHRGFQTEEEAYEWLKVQVGMRSRLNAYGICDLDTLRSQRLVIVDNVQRSVQETYCRKPAEVKEYNNIEELERDIDELGKNRVPRKRPSKKSRKQDLVKRFEAWLDILEGDQEE